MSVGTSELGGAERCCSTRHLPLPPLQGPPGGSFSSSWPAVSLQGCSSRGASQGARRKQRAFTPLHRVRRRGKMGHQHGKEVQGEEKTLHGLPWTPGEPSLPLHRLCRTSLLSCYPTALDASSSIPAPDRRRRIPCQIIFWLSFSKSS